MHALEARLASTWANLGDVILRKLGVATRDLRKRIHNIHTTKERLAKLKDALKILQTGKLPKSTHRPGMSFECATLNQEAHFNSSDDFPINLLQSGLVFRVQNGEDIKATYKDIIQEAFAFQQLVKTTVEVRVAEIHLTKTPEFSCLFRIRTRVFGSTWRSRIHHRRSWN